MFLVCLSFQKIEVVQFPKKQMTQKTVMLLVFLLTLLQVAMRSNFQHHPGTWSLEWCVILDDAFEHSELPPGKLWCFSLSLWMWSLVWIFSSGFSNHWLLLNFPVWFLCTSYQTRATTSRKALMLLFRSLNVILGMNFFQWFFKPLVAYFPVWFLCTSYQTRAIFLKVLCNIWDQSLNCC